MDQELKSLLTQLIDKLDSIETRLKAVEEVAHKQTTLEDLRKAFPPGQPRQLPSMPQPEWWPEIKPICTMRPLTGTAC